MDNGDINQQFLKAYEKLADGIFRYCYLRISDREKARDIMQETFIKTWKYLAEGHAINNLKAFLYRTASNLIIDEYRKNKTVSLDLMREKDGFDPVGDDAGDIIDLAEAQNAIRLINKLEPGYREIIIMRYINDLSVKDIAQILGESENNVSVKIHRGLEKLKSLMNGE